jgi:ABC-2 type transport system permease protein
MNFLKHSYYLAIRDLRSLARQPWYIALTIIQPILSLTLYGQVFQRVAELPGFRGASYMNFLTPGIIILTAFVAGGWHGMAILREMERGTLDRFLVCPVSRSAIFFGRIASMNLVISIQALILLVISFSMGGRFSGGLTGMAILMLNALLLSTTTSLLSNGVALIVRKEESLICVSNFLLFPAAFLSSIFMSENLMPGWIRTLFRFNPVNWGVESGRAALNGRTERSLVLGCIAGLLLVLALSAGFASYAFSVYRRSP